MTLKKRIEEYLEYCKYRKELDFKTLKAYRIDLRQFQEFIGEDYLNRKKIDDFITELHKKFKQKTIKRKIASVKAFYTCLEEREILEGGNPFDKLKVKFKEEKVLPRVIPRCTIEKLLNHMYKEKQKNSTLRDIAVVEFLFATGVRVCEVSNLKKEAVDLSSGVIRIMGKGKKERYIQISNPEVLNILKRYYEVYRERIEQAGYFFVNNRGGGFSEQSIRLMIKKYVEAAGISQHITPHMFRHSVATYLIEEGADITYVQKILGHSSIKTTQIYINVAARLQAEVMRSMHPRNKMKIVA